VENNIQVQLSLIESRIRRARIERSLAIGYAIGEAGMAIGRGLRRLVRAIGRGVEAERDRRAIEADVFLKRSVPRY
jgi:hypothetical protein